MVRVQQAPFDLNALYHSLSAERTDIGAVASFVGRVRDFNEQPDVEALTLEHYPGMTEAVLTRIVEQAEQRWSLANVIVVHRVGRLTPGDDIVVVLVASAHRHAAFEACEFIMDLLKTQAPFWKKEHTRQGDYWVSERHSDKEARQRWEQG
ncbi:molybdopterin synthase catalytic subunit MoaE [Phytohalomonas tamaricis]|uniref:molybdopterin synthase catalytic subunit MoaE n=1 Tax=Phytohalomonas tamaricis TaxID=2081032 RepID=UPI000D0AFF25|nr:molybdopterin synthase catalytic subunit MoaE [Phytohalomonas tamaricis]